MKEGRVEVLLLIALVALSSLCGFGVATHAPQPADLLHLPGFADTATNPACAKAIGLMLQATNVTLQSDPEQLRQILEEATKQRAACSEIHDPIWKNPFAKRLQKKFNWRKYAGASFTRRRRSRRGGMNLSRYRYLNLPTMEEIGRKIRRRKLLRRLRKDRELNWADSRMSGLNNMTSSARQYYGYYIRTEKKPHPRTCLERCPFDRKPVCDSNGKVYKNACIFTCLAKYRGIDDKFGMCPPPGVSPPSLEDCKHCSRLYAPTCNIEGKQFYNPCYAKCETEIVIEKRLAKAGKKYIAKHKAKIEREREIHLVFSRSWCNHPSNATLMICPRVVQPVCAVDGTIHVNFCIARAEGESHQVRSKWCEKRKKRDRQFEACRDKCESLPLDTVCDAFGNTYWNKECARCYGLGENAVMTSWCADKPGSRPYNCNCPTKKNIVCDRWGRQYPNACVARCKKIGAMKQFCKTQFRRKTKCHCIKEKAQVCTRDGKKYRNSCYAKCAGSKDASPKYCKATQKPKTINTNK